MLASDWFLYAAVVAGLVLVAWIAYSLGRADGREAQARDYHDQWQRIDRETRRLPRDAHGRWLDAGTGRRA
jgi:hypothetical protein